LQAFFRISAKKRAFRILTTAPEGADLMLHTPQTKLPEPELGRLRELAKRLARLPNI